MAAVQNRGLKIAFFLLGLALPVAGFFVWQRTGMFRCSPNKERLDALQEKAVEDSFPASDPPSSW
jgi:hypothetical protein